MTAAWRLDAALHQAWSQRLGQWWRYYNEEYAGGGLQPPRIELGQAAAELGRWERDRRRIVISREHLERDPWLVVMATLRHEMAHQYADEVLQALDEPAHGPAFQHACWRLRADPRGRQAGSPAALAAGEERIVARLRKVLSLAGSPNQHEAEAAVQKARRLLLRYNVDLVSLDQERQFEHRWLGEVRSRRASYELWLAQILHDYFFVETIWVESYRPLQDRVGTVLQISGTRANLDMAAYVYEYLTGLLEPLWRRYRRRRRLGGNGERQRFWAGLMEGFLRRLQEQEKGLHVAEALVWQGDARLQEYQRYLYPRMRTRSTRGVAATQAYRDGYREGRSISIRRPVAEAGRGFGGYLSGT
ncbi:MAG: DUF2786 domain-containing protein [Candidatus Latescibacterota bacterium]